MNNDKNKVIVTNLTQEQIDNSLKWLERARADKTNKPCDGFELAKSSKWSIILSPLMALCGWLILLWLISRR